MTATARFCYVPKHVETCSRVTIWPFGMKLKIKGWLFGTVLAVSIGFFFVWLRADAMIELLHKYHPQVKQVIDVLFRPPQPRSAVSANDRLPDPTSKTQPAPRKSPSPELAPVGGGNAADSPPPIASRSQPSLPRSGVRLYRAHTSKLRGRVLPLREAPGPEAKIIVAIPPEARDIKATGRKPVLHPEPVWPYTEVLWREVIYQGVRGWASVPFLKRQ